MKKLIYMIAAAAVAIPVVALAQGACGSGSCSKGDKDMAEAKELRCDRDHGKGVNLG